DGDFTVARRELRAFTAVRLCVVAQRNAGVLKQELTHALLAESIALQGPGMFRAEHDHGLVIHTQTIAPNRGQRGTDGAQQNVAALGLVLAYSARRLSSKQRERALMALQSAINVERLPGILFFISAMHCENFPELPWADMSM